MMMTVYQNMPAMRVMSYEDERAAGYQDCFPKHVSLDIIVWPIVDDGNQEHSNELK